MASARWQAITESIRASIESGQLPPGERLPSESALAEQWGVCRMTIHRAMQELQRQGFVIRQRRSGTVVADGASDRRVGSVALLFFHTNDFPQVEYIHGIRAALPDAYHLLLCDTRNDPHREAQYLRRMQVEADGIICYPTAAPQNTPLLRRILERTPIVCVDRVPDGLESDGFVTDNYGSALDALRFLRARGHRRIAHFTDDKMQLSSVRERCEAYRQVMREAGEPNPERWERRFPPGPGRNFDHMVQCVHDALFTLLHQPDPPTAVFCLEDYYMAAVQEACVMMGRVVPDDLEILSFSDCPPVMMQASRSVHRIVQCANEMGQRAAERLQQRWQRGQHEALPAQVVRVPARFFPAINRSGAPTALAAPSRILSARPNP